MTLLHLAVASVFVSFDAASCSADAPPTTPAVDAAERSGADPAAAPDTDAIVGSWANAEHSDLVVKVSRSGSGFAGTVTQAPDDRLLGKELFRGVVYNATKGEYTGELFAVRKKKWVPATFTVDGGQMTLRAGRGLRSKTVKWKRA